MKRTSYIATFLLLTISIISISCNKRPSYVLSASEMENVLYDYHLVQAMLEQMPSVERDTVARKYIDAVLAKHGISEAQFDSSIVYYNRHTKELSKIYANLQEKYTKAHEELQLQNGNNNMTAVFTQGGDTANIWNADKLIMLRNTPLLCQESYTIKADTSYYDNDQFTLMCEPLFFNEATGSHDCDLTIGMSLQYKNGKTIGSVRHFSSTYGIQQITMTANNELSAVSTFFYYNGKSNTRNMVAISNLQLIRMHQIGATGKTEQAADTIETDTLSVDTLKQDTAKPERRYTPEEIRQLNKSDKQITIQEAPTVRTPNSFGTRRKPQNRRTQPSQKSRQ